METILHSQECNPAIQSHVRHKLITIGSLMFDIQATMNLNRHWVKDVDPPIKDVDPPTKEKEKEKDVINLCRDWDLSKTVADDALKMALMLDRSLSVKSLTEISNMDDCDFGSLK